MCLNETNIKKSITCVNSYLGRLVCAMENPPLFNDQVLVFWTLCKNGEIYKLDNIVALPDKGVRNLSTSISFDQDFIILGDVCKDISIVKHADKEEMTKERTAEKNLHIIKYKQTNINANVIGAYSLSKHLSFDNLDLKNKISQEGFALGTVVHKTSQQKKMLTLLSVT